ncbi:MAG: outer membrane lipoprotein-sorting protein [Candidatus Bipolaricaulia bacterium]
MMTVKDGLKYLIVFTVVLVLSIGVSLKAADSLTGEEILEKVDKQQEVITQGDLVSILTFKIKYPDGTTTTRKFGSLARKKAGKPDRTLIYYLKPESVRGSMLLSRETKEGKTEMWLLLAAFPKPKKLPSAQKQKSFAGSTLTFQEIGNRNMNERYKGELVTETEIEIGEETVPAYLLELRAEEGVETRYPRGKVWVGKENWLILRSEDYNSDGKLERILEVKELTTFEGKTVMKKLYSKNVLDGSATTIIFENRHRPDKSFPPRLFKPENLTEFDPEKWGITQTK